MAFLATRTRIPLQVAHRSLTSQQQLHTLRVSSSPLRSWSSDTRSWTSAHPSSNAAKQALSHIRSPPVFSFPLLGLRVASVRNFASSASFAGPAPRDPLQAEREAATVAGNRAARARTESLGADGSQGGASSGKGPDGDKEVYGSRLKRAWKETPIKWYPIPILLGAIVLIGVQARRLYNADQSGKGKIVDGEGKVVTMSGPWAVYVLAALPLNAISRLWGWANDLTLPVWFRPFGFRLYARIFGCNLDEMNDPDLTHYRSLGEFFYRELAPGMRIVDEEAPIVSPADGTILHFGTIKGRQVEQVKGITYSLDALLGLSSSPEGIEEVRGPGSDLDDKEFAAINGIDYSLDRLLGDEKLKKMGKRFVSWKWWKSWVVSPKKANKTGIPAASQPDQADKTAAKPDPDDGDDEPAEAGVETPDTPEILSRYASVAYEMGSGALPPILQRHSPGQEGVADGNKLHFAVVYLAPGDYHRFHSPTNWVVERRRHFRGELYSVSPYIANRLSNLFILNERVALLGRWRYGFFSMIPVGATNVGSIKVNFDADLRTNVREQRPLAGTFSEASYGKASRLLGGQPLSKGEEMGGFLLGSTIVLVWESPDFAFEIEPGQKVKVGQRLGDLGFKQISEEERRRHQTKKRWWFF